MTSYSILRPSQSLDYKVVSQPSSENAALTLEVKAIGEVERKG